MAVTNYVATMNRGYQYEFWNWPGTYGAGQGKYQTTDTNPRYGFFSFSTHLAGIRSRYAAGERMNSITMDIWRENGSWGSARTVHFYGSQINPAALPADKPSVAFTPNRTGALYDIAIPACTVNGQYRTITIPSALMMELINDTTATGIQIEYTGTTDYMMFGDVSGQMPTLKIDWYWPYSACVAPTSRSVAPTISEGNATLSWSGAAGGTANAITGYEIQYAESSDGAAWGAWTALQTVVTSATSGSLSVAPPATRGYFRKYRIRTQGAAGSSWYSAWVETTNTLQKNRAPAAPTNPATATAHPETSYDLTWTAATDPDGQAVTYTVRRYVWNTGTGAYDEIAAVTGIAGASYSWDISGYPRGQRVYMTVKTVDSLGAESADVGTGVAIYRNQLPAQVSLGFPAAAGVTIYNTTPRVGMMLNADPEGATMRAHLTLAGTVADTEINNTGYWSRTGRFASGQKLVMKGISAAPGSASLLVDSMDDRGVFSATLSRSFTVATPSFTDSTLVGATENPTHPELWTAIKAVHMTELLTMVNNVRAYYGLAAAAWTGAAPGAAADIRAQHVLDLRQAMEDIRTLVNAYDSNNAVNDIAAFAWAETISAGVDVKAAHIRELRSKISLL